MTTFDTAAIHNAALDVSAHAAPTVDAIALIQQPIGTSTVQPIVETAAQTPLDEPSSLALVLIGFGTLVVYRGIVQRMTAKPVARQAPRPLVKPRRRAA
jgi:hypothetical protein